MTYTAALLEVIRNILGPDAAVTDRRDGRFTVAYEGGDIPVADYTHGEILTMCAEMVREQENDAAIVASRKPVDGRLNDAAARFGTEWFAAFGEDARIDVEDGLILIGDGISRTSVYLGVAMNNLGWDVCDGNAFSVARGLPLVDAIAAAIAHERAAR